MPTPVNQMYVVSYTWAAGLRSVPDWSAWTRSTRTNRIQGQFGSRSQEAHLRAEFRSKPSRESRKSSREKNYRSSQVKKPREWAESKLERTAKQPWVRLNPVAWTCPVPAQGLIGRDLLIHDLVETTKLGIVHGKETSKNKMPAPKVEPAVLMAAVVQPHTPLGSGGGRGRRHQHKGEQPR